MIEQAETEKKLFHEINAPDVGGHFERKVTSGTTMMKFVDVCMPIYLIGTMLVVLIFGEGSVFEIK